MNEKRTQKDAQAALEFGKWVGRRQAFSQVAGRCSAADAQCLRELRESKRYKVMGLTWEQVCKQEVGICRSVADLIIRNLEEFGPDYFVLAQATGISAQEYRRIQGAVAHHALLHAGEEIPIELENGPKLVAAVAALRREPAVALAQPADPAADAERGLAKAGRAMQAALAELNRLRLLPLDIEDRMRLRAAIDGAAGELKLLDLQVRV